MITLTRGTAYAVINPDGAWLEELATDGQPILFPKTELMSESGDKKARGGMHVCLPNFGPGGDGGLAQHGFGRTLTWSVVEQNGSHVVLELRGPEGLYDGLAASLDYMLDDSALTATLTVRNEGQAPFRIAPGFHPYFYLDESETAVSVNDTVYELSSLSGTEFLQTDSLMLQTANRKLTLGQQGLATWALWTDGLANYVCAEPTYGGYRFLEAPTPEEHLAPSTEKVFACSIAW